MRSVFILLAALALALPARALTYVVSRIAAESQLANTNVTAALQGRDGPLWLATGGGLARFDGVGFHLYRPGNEPAFETALVTCLAEDTGGDLWIGTGSGLVRRHAGAFSPAGLRNLSVDTVAAGPSGRMWFGTHERGVFTWDGTAMQALGADLPAPFVTCLFTASDGRLWIGYGGVGVAAWSEGHLAVYFSGGELGDRVESIAEQPRGTLWLGTHNHGLYRWRAGALTHFGAAEGLAGSEVTDLRATADGGLWVVTGRVQKLLDPDRPRFESLGRTPTENVARVAEDREGDLWLCAREDGLFRARAFPSRSITTVDGLPENTVRTVSEDPAGNLWLALPHRGVARVGPDGAVRLYGRKEGLTDDDPASAFAAADGSIWIGGNGDLTVLRGAGGPSSFPGLQTVRGIYQDRTGTMWLGTDEHGLARLDAGHVLPGDPPFALNHACAFAEAEDESLYVGLWAGGLARIHGRDVRRWRHADGLPSDEVRAVWIDREGEVWVGFRTRGLALMRNGGWWNPDALSEAVANHVSAIVDDDRGRLWLGTAAGILWAWKSELRAAAAGGPLPTLHATGLGGGGQPLQVWSGPQPTCGRTRRGEIVFATRQGVIAIDPESLTLNPVPPPVTIEEVALDRRSVAAGPSVRIPAGTRQLKIDYAAASFVQPERVAFRYQLEGYDEAMVDAGSRRTAYYGEIPPGRYRFRVIAANNDGLWNETGASLILVQAPPFYRTGAFYGLAAAAALALLWGGYRWSHRRLELRLERLEQRQAMERERQRIAKNLHDDLGANLTELGLFAEAARARTNLPEALSDVAALSDRVRGIARSLDAVVWTVNPANDSLEQLASYLCDYFQSLFGRTNIRCRIDAMDEIPALPLTPEARSNLFLTAKEAINNVVRHSGATEAWLRLAFAGGCFTLEIADDGRGFDPADPAHARRNGLANMRSRVAELGGTLTLVSAPGSGTRLGLSIPFHAHPTLHR